VKDFNARMLEEYHTLVDPLDADEREELRAKWQETLAKALEDDGRSLSAAARLKRAEKWMLQAVGLCFYLMFCAEFTVWN
jgi:hypothetical protein